MLFNAKDGQLRVEIGENRCDTHDAISTCVNELLLTALPAYISRVGFGERSDADCSIF